MYRGVLNHVQEEQLSTQVKLKPTDATAAETVYGECTGSTKKHPRIRKCKMIVQGTQKQKTYRD